MDYEGFSDYVFATPISLYVEKPSGTPLVRVVTNMNEYLSLYDEIRSGEIIGKLGDFTVEQQLWLNLAIYSFFLKEPGPGKQ